MALVARTQGPLQEVAQRLHRDTGRPVHAVAGDVSHDEAAADVMSRALEALEGVDVLVNTATGRDRGRPSSRLEHLDTELVLGAFNDKVMGYLRCTRAVVPGMVEQGWGRVVNLAGITARTGGSALTSARNAAVVAMTSHLAREFGSRGVNVTAVHPGLTWTERTPVDLQRRATEAGVTVEEVSARLGSRSAIGRLVTADEVADVVAFLASPRSVAINGDAVPVGGGWGDVIAY